ncbi:MAG: T9SS type A sorting domain-containing protein, partial [Bacteroidia bacterium]
MKNLSIFIFLILSVFTANAVTYFNGGIFANTTWTLANSPYILNGSVVIFPGKTLTIEPGVVVKVVSSSANNGEQIYLECRGNLIAEGTSNNPISFIPETKPSNAFEQVWYGIRIKGTQGGSAKFKNIVLNNSYWGISNDAILYDSVRFESCKFSGNNYVFSMGVPLVLTDCEFVDNGVVATLMLQFGSAVVNNCTFKRNAACFSTLINGIEVYNSSFENNTNCFLLMSGKFRNCTFKQNETVFQENGALDIESCEFIQNKFGIKGFSGSSCRFSTFSQNEVAIIAEPGSIIQNNTILNNGVGIVLGGSTWVPAAGFDEVKDNKICYSSLYNIENKTDINWSLAKNCFCSIDSASIDAGIYDGYDDITRGLINFMVFDSTCVNALQMVEKVQLKNPTGLNQFISNIHFSVFPNPTSEYVLIQSNQQGEEQFLLYDLQGKILKTTISFMGVARFDMTDLTEGLYFIKS